MPSIPPLITRTTSLLSSDSLLGRLRETQRDMLDMERQISTGKRYSVPSDAPDKAAAINYLQRQLGAEAQYARNLDHALSLLNTTDGVLSEAGDTLNEAKTAAMGQIGVGSDAESRQTTSLVIDSQLDALVDLANRRLHGMAMFGGNVGGDKNQPVFESFLGGVRYRGSTETLRADVGTTGGQEFTQNGAEVFGALSARVISEANLQPKLSADTRLADLGGTQLEGIRKGPVVLDVDGTKASVDLSSADALGDVLTRVNEAIENIDPAAGSLALTGSGFELTAAGGHAISLTSAGSGKTAADLGIELSASGSTASGSWLHRRLTETTRLSDLGASVDFASGMQITQGSVTKTADFSSAQTVQDLMSVVDGLDLGLRLEINEKQTGVNLVSEVSGVRLSVGESGGTTAADLGLRTLGDATRLSEFRDGRGVEKIKGENDFAIALHDGTRFEVDLDGLSTVGDVVGEIQNAAAAAGVAAGDFSVSHAATGNGLVFTDNTVGGDDFVIENIGESHAASHLGIAGNAGAGNTLAGEDHATVRVEGMFTHLIDLRDSLSSNDESGITLAGSRLEDDIAALGEARGNVGVQAKKAEDEKVRLEDRQLMEETMLSDLQDADLTEVITRFTQLQQQLQASLRVGAQNMQMNLMDFLR